MEHAVSPGDSAHVARLREAGAIPLARTNLPDFALRWHTDNALRGATKNPWDPHRTPGGSSGGEAASLAAGMTPLGLGNDLGGSLRWPSQCCGTAAIKPSFGRIATASAVPSPENPLTLQMFAVEGPMARNVRDLRLALRLMSVPDARDALYVPAPFDGPSVPRRVAMCVDPAGMGVSPAIAEGVRKAGEMLRDAGYEVEEVDAPMVAEAFQLWARLLLSDVETVFLPVAGQLLSADAATFLRYAIAGAPPFTYPEYMVGWMQRHAIANAWEGFLARYPLLLGPVSTMQPFPVGYDLAGQEQMYNILTAHRLIVTANLLGLPAAVVPVDVANGLPQGVQIIGARYREDLCLDAAEAIESRAGALTPIDPR
jgi:amidase